MFASELGTMKHFKAKVSVVPGAKPKFCRAHPVPFALWSGIEESLDREADGVLERVSHSEWAAPVVIVPKDGTIQLAETTHYSTLRRLQSYC